jgi:hypothetical protein
MLLLWLYYGSAEVAGLARLEIRSHACQFRVVMRKRRESIQDKVDDVGGRSMTRHVWKFHKGRIARMKAWLNKFLLLFWPWSKIDELERALTAQNQMLIAANDRYNGAYRDGFTHHLQQWMANANRFYGPEPFRDGQKSVMIDLYNRGLTIKEALEMLYVTEARGERFVSYGRSGFDERKDFQK